MSGEWMKYDCCLPHKPEVLELVDRTGMGVDQVVGRLVLLWGWASLNSADGTARLSLRLLCRLCGGDEDFWKAVQDVGWLDVDAEAGTVAIPGWERRFSKSAKSRAMHAIRAEDSRGGAPKRTTPCAKAHAPVRRRALERGDREERNSSSSPREAAHEDQAGPAGWETVRSVWADVVKRGHGKPWDLAAPPDQLQPRLAEDGWFQKFLAAVERLPKCRFFESPATLPQLVLPGFVDKILGGQMDNPRHRPSGRPDDRPPPQAWTGDDAARFEATKASIVQKLKEVS